MGSRPLHTRPAAGILDRRTPRDREILVHLAYGLSNDELAEKLYLSIATVKTHVCRIITKLDVRDRTQAVVVAYQTGLAQPGGAP